MPLIEVLPNSTAASAPGWAYVPDTGYDPSKTAIQPSGTRHRAARNAGGASAHDRSARQNTAIQKHLAELDRDNHRDVQISVSARQREGAGRGSRAKVPSGVRRILTSQKTFANHLADEEAAIANQTHPLAAQNARPANQAVGKKANVPGTARTKRRASSPTHPAGEDVQESTKCSELAGGLSSTTRRPEMNVFSKDDNDPLLQSYVPPLPPKAVLEEILAAPPLSYAAARAQPSSSGHPQRYFCEICGYWGRVRCLRCAARVCGLDCKGVHDDGRCLKFYS
ncbi:MAG: hypothetical protein M1837_003499 [Sclerophora amabilis]|nr:MAG: hypothetical protein M1837_003499 [Sclerophora amabilis]